MKPSAVLVHCALLAGLMGCFVPRLDRALFLPQDLHEIPRNTPYLKAHMQSGTVYIFDSWHSDQTGQIITGRGQLLDINRRLVKKGTFKIGVDSVALFETNILNDSGPSKALMILTLASAGITLYCVSNPKACFGSCPTFYVYDGDTLRLQAEGFSSSISRSLEQSDVDMLYFARPVGGRVEIVVKNEALETHVIRYADLLIVPREPNRYVFKTPSGEFMYTAPPVTPVIARAAEGDILSKIRRFDHDERFSQADSTNLAAKEIVYLEFDPVPAGRYGLIISARQTLMTTFLFYQTLAYAGRYVGELLARIEREAPRSHKALNGIGNLLGGITLQYFDPMKQKWVETGEVRETGPIATDTWILPFSHRGGPVHLRLSMTKGNWRIDYLALAEIREKATPLRLTPARVMKDGMPREDVREKLIDREQSLVMLPGDVYTLIYQLPETVGEAVYFLESRGYYYEWIRKEWLQEENPDMLLTMLQEPERALKLLAPEYKKIEQDMEKIFWSSRYAR